MRITPREPATITVYYNGEPPILVRAGWIDVDPVDNDSFIVLTGIEPIHSDFSDCELLWKEEIQKFALEAESLTADEADLLAETLDVGATFHSDRVDAIEDHYKASLFFLNLDVGSDPFLGTSGLGQEILDTSALLQHRIDVRVMTGKQGQVPEFEDLDNTFDELISLEAVSLYLKTLIAVHLQDLKPRDLVGWAFEMFATDRLGVTHHDTNTDGELLTAGRPDGVFFFQFAELAFCCLRANVHHAFWMKHIQAFVRASQMFVEHGPQQTVAAGYPLAPEDYATAPGRFYSRARMQKVRKQHHDLNMGKQNNALVQFLEDRFTSLLSKCLVDPPGVPIVSMRAPHVDAEVFPLMGGKFPVPSYS